MVVVVRKGVAEGLVVAAEGGGVMVGMPEPAVQVCFTCPT